MKMRRYTTPKMLGPQVRVKCWATARGKRRYSRERVERALKRQQAAFARGEASSRCIRFYLCPACNAYHLTSMALNQGSGEARAA